MIRQEKAPRRPSQNEPSPQLFVILKFLSSSFGERVLNIKYMPVKKFAKHLDLRKSAILGQLPQVQVLLLLHFFLLFALMIPSLSFGEGKIIKEENLKSAIQQHGRVRVIVSFQLPKLNTLATASKSYQQGTSSNPQHPDRILERSIAEKAQELYQRLPEKDFTYHRAFSFRPGMVLSINGSALELLEKDDEVISIREDTVRGIVPPSQGEMKTDQSSIEISSPMLNDSTDLIKADNVWSQGITGAGIYVAVVDTGVLTSHEMFVGKDIVEACFSTTYEYYDATSSCPNGAEVQMGTGAAIPPDHSDAQHGTHVAGIATGYNTDVDPGEPTHGVAYDAGIIAINVFSKFDNTYYCGGSTPCYLSFSSDQLSALEYVYSLRNDYTIAAVNLSLGGGQYSSSCDNSDSLTSIVGLLKEANIATVIATGNDGYCGYVSSPACISSAIAVGASTKNDAEASYNNFSSTLQDLFAPGSSISSAISSGDSDYDTWNGTSMATPHVAGVFALFREAYPTYTVDQMENALKNTGTRISTTCSNMTATIPRIDIAAALGDYSGNGEDEDPQPRIEPPKGTGQKMAPIYLLLLKD